MPRYAYVNGDFFPHEEAKISILDRGFLFADGIYEVSAVLDGKLVDNDSHLARLKRSVGEIELGLPGTLAEIEVVQRALIEKNGVKEGLVYLQVTRGAALERDFPFPPAGTKPSLVMFTQEKNLLKNPTAEKGIAVKSVADIRWARRDIKSVALLAQVLAKQAAAAEGCQEAWMHEDGVVTEGGSSTAFILTKDNVLVTRNNSQKILPGCTRFAVEKLIAEEGVTYETRPFTLDEAHTAKEAFYTSASSFVMPIVTLDGKAIGDGKPGALTKRLREHYIAFALKTAK
jgi:D-alanine transaminase